MNSIEYIEEDVKEEVAVLYLDPSRNGKFENEEIFDLIRAAGIDFQDGDEFEIVPRDENGVARVVVYRHVKRQVPYKVERTLIGTFPLDANLQTDETQRDRAYALMHLAGLDVEDESKFEIETQKDEMGRVIAYVVYQIQKTPLQEDKSIVLVSSDQNQKMDTIEDMRRSLEELKVIRASLNNISDEIEKKKTIETLVNGIQSLEERVDHPVSILKDSILDQKMKNVEVGVEALKNGLVSMIDSVSLQNKSYKDQVDEPIPTKMADLLKNEIIDLDQKINDLEEEIQALLAEYEQSESRFEEVEEESRDNEDALLSEEEQDEKNVQKMKKIVDENNISSAILRMIDDDKKRLNLLKGKRKLKQADLERAEALDLTVEEYLEIQDAVGRKKIEEALMSRKGLLDIFHKPAKERTSEESEKLRLAKDEIFKEIHEKRQEESMSVFDAIQVLYHLDLTFSQGEHPKVLKVSQRDVDMMEEMSSHTPTKIAGKPSSNTVDYVPDEMPEDMKDTVDSEDEDHLGFTEKIALFRDVYTGEIYIREYGLDRFNLIPIGPSVKINGALCYPITEEDAQRIVDKQNNQYSPYVVVSRGIESVQASDRKESLESIIYIKKLLDYVKEHNISIYHYYVDLANHYREDKDFVPEEFELHNPFLKEEDYENLIQSKEERISQYFASAMRRVIDFHLAEYRDPKFHKSEERFEVELHQDEYFEYGEHYYVEFHYTNEEQKRKIFELFEKKLLPAYGAHSDRFDQKLEYIMPYLVDDEGNFTVDETNTIGGTSIPEDLLDEFMKIFIEEEDATLIVGDEQMSESFDEERFHTMIAKLAEEKNYSQEEVQEYIKKLSDYTLKNNISVHDYYKNLAKSYREKDHFEAEDFEKMNPFIDKDKYQNLITNDQDSIVDDFADEMSRIVQEQRNDKDLIDLTDTKEQDDHETVSVYQDRDNDDEKYLQDKDLSKYKIDPISGEFNINGDPSYRISEEDFNRLKNELDEKKIPLQTKDVHLGDKRDLIDKIVFYQDADNHNDIYVSKYVLTRFHIEPTSEEKEAQDRYVFRIREEDAQYIIDHQDNQYSPYKVEVRTIHFGKDDSLEDDSKELILYRDLDDNNQVYSSEAILNFFHMIPEGEVTVIEGEPCYKIDTTTEQEMQRLANSSKDPKVVIHYRDVHLKKKDDFDVEYIPLFRDVDHDNQLYANPTILERFGLKPEGDSQLIGGLECYKVLPKQFEVIQQKVDESENPKLAIQYIDVHVKDPVGPEPPEPPEDPIEEEEKPRKGEIHYQTVIQKLTEGLDHLGVKGAKRFRASNVSVRQAASELRTGNWLYNVFGSIPGVVTMPFLWFRKIGAKLMLRQDVKADYEELQRRLDEDLSEEELEVLFQKYRGSNAIADMNPSINSMIADRMRRYVLEKVERINAVIKIQYASLFGYLEQIKAIEEQLQNTGIGEAEVEALMNQRKDLVGVAADCARNISSMRDEGIQLLSGGGLHSFEEDMKAVDSKMNYVGYRFAKAGKFDHKTQELLAQFGQGFNDALANDDDEAILENFLNYEACYYDNTEIRNSIFGKRSVGTKYYTPLVEVLDYKDDPFIRNLLSTVAIVSSAVSAVNAYHVHKTEADRVLQAQQQEAQKVNAHNNDAINQAHQVGRNIEGHRQEMIDGMESQVHHGVDEAALGLERSALDGTANPVGWNLGGNYSSIDQANHVFYNNFHQDVSSRINDVAARYGAGSIDQMQALREMATIANDSQSTLNSVVNDCLTTLRDYAQNHPQFDLAGIEESMSYIVSNPDAIMQMNNGVVDIMEQAGTLSGLSAAQMTALSSLPSDMLTTIISAASAATLALHVSSSLSHQYGHRGHYGNEVTDMMEDFLEGEEVPVEEEEEEHHHTR